MNRILPISSCFALLAVLPACHGAQSRVVSSSKPVGHEAQVRAVLNHALPSLKGDRLKATVVEVTYAGAGFSRPHRHPCPVIGYVVEGALRTGVDETPETIIHAGETFYEAPKGLHRVSANASEKEPVRFLAFFLCDNDQPLSVAEPPVSN
jgi:quercetin dioxygenase-like cupin family protein